MITISEIVVIGLLEIFVVLLLAVGLLLFFNHNLHRRGTTLATQLDQLKQTTKDLLEKANQQGKKTYSYFLEQTLTVARGEAGQLLHSEGPNFSSEHTESEKAALMRYLLLDAELAVENEPNDALKSELRTTRLASIIQELDLANPRVEEHEPGKTGLDEADLKQKWGYLCEAAVDLVVNRSVQSADDLIEIVKVINADLSLEDITLPERDEPTQGDVTQIRAEVERNREVIANLLAERNAAEAEVSIKVTELERLERFLKESEVVITQLEQDHQVTLAELEKLQKNAEKDDDVEEMKNLIQRFSRESSEMLICIETLEQENSDLKAQLGPQ